MKGIISKSYGEKRVFENFSFEFNDGEITCVLGASGAGKTTLLNILARCTSFQGELQDVPNEVGYIFQEPRLLPNLTVAQNLEFAGGRYEAIEEMLQKIGLYEHKDKRPSMLSGGEKQRVAIARAFLSGRKLLLLDEPFSSLDTPLKIKLWQVLAKLWIQDKPTAVMVTHDIEEAWALGHRVVYIKDGKIAYDCRVERTDFPAKYGEYSAQKQAFIERVLSEGENK